MIGVEAKQIYGYDIDHYYAMEDKMKRTRNLLLLWLLLCLFVASCTSPAALPPGSSPTASASPDLPSGSTSPTASASPDLPSGSTSPTSAQPTSAHPIQTSDALGRIVTLASPPQRLVTAGKGVFMLTDALYLFPGARSKVVAIGQGQPGYEGFLALVAPATATVQILSGGGGVEPIAAARPDLVILKSYSASSIGAQLEKLNLATLYLELESPEQYVRDLATLGRALGEEERGAALAKYYEEEGKKVADTVALLPVEKRPRVLLAEVTNKGGSLAVLVPPANWIQTTMVERAGGIAVWKEASQGGGWAVVNLEQIAAWNPDVILLIDYQGDPSQDCLQLVGQPGWKELKAVQGKRLFGFPKDFASWDQPDARWILGQKWIAGRLHPDLFPHLEMKSEAASFFLFAYGIDPARFESQIAPRLAGDL
jgi:iron complex transport system substrate-binding protein